MVKDLAFNEFIETNLSQCTYEEILKSINMAIRIK